MAGRDEKNFQVGLAKGVTLVAAGLTLRDKTVAISDLSDVGRRLLGHPLDMILGRELFDATALRIDLGRRELDVLGKDSQRRGVRYELKTVNGIEVFPVRLEGEETLAAFDLGNGSNILMPASVDEGDSATDLNVGISVLRHFVMTVDFPGRALWLEGTAR